MSDDNVIDFTTEREKSRRTQVERLLNQHGIEPTDENCEGALAGALTLPLSAKTSINSLELGFIRDQQFRVLSTSVQDQRIELLCTFEPVEFSVDWRTEQSDDKPQFKVEFFVDIAGHLRMSYAKL